MDSEASLVREVDEDILYLDAPDDALERAAGLADGRVITWGFCTNWYHCRWPD